MFTDTIGRRWSSERITSRPFGSVYFSKGMVGAPFVDVDAAGVVVDVDVFPLPLQAVSDATISKPIALTTAVLMRMTLLWRSGPVYCRAMLQIVAHRGNARDY